MAKCLPCDPDKQSRDNYRAWLFDQQDGVCYLGIHPQCVKVGRQMSISQKVNKSRFATFEHVVAKARRPRVTLVLLACYQCNARKAAAEPAAEHVEYARRLRKLWFERHNWPPPIRMGATRQLEIEAEQREHRAAIGLNPGRRTSKYLSNLRKATERSMGWCCS